MPRMRTGLYSLDVRLGVLPTMELPGGSFTSPGILAPVAPASVSSASRVPGAGIGRFPTERRDRLAQAADRGGGLAKTFGETVDGGLLHRLRDSLRALVATDGTVGAQSVKAQLDLFVATPGSERRLNEALSTILPGWTVMSLKTDLVSGVYYSGSHETGYEPPPLPAEQRSRTPAPVYTPLPAPVYTPLPSPGDPNSGGGLISAGSPFPTGSGNTGLPASVAVEIPPTVQGTFDPQTALDEAIATGQQRSMPLWQGVVAVFGGIVLGAIVVRAVA